MECQSPQMFSSFASSFLLRFSFHIQVVKSDPKEEYQQFRSSSNELSNFRRIRIFQLLLMVDSFFLTSKCSLLDRMIATPDGTQYMIDITHGGYTTFANDHPYVSWSDMSPDNAYFVDFLNYFHSHNGTPDDAFLHYPQDTLVPVIVPSNTVAGQTRRAACMEDRFHKV